MSQALCSAQRPNAQTTSALSSSDQFESIFSKWLRHQAVEWTHRKNLRALSQLDTAQLRDIGVLPWQMNEVSRKSASAHVLNFVDVKH